MLDSTEEVLCFYVQDVKQACRDIKDKILNLYYHEALFISDKQLQEKMKYLNFEVQNVLDFVTRIPLVYKERKLEVTGATNDQVIMVDWYFLKETFQEYVDKIAKNIKKYYENIGKFYNAGELNENVIIKINKKDYTYNEVNNLFTLSIIQLSDISPLVYYDKFRDTLR
jgi:hypothetical protein